MFKLLVLMVAVAGFLATVCVAAIFLLLYMVDRPWFDHLNAAISRIVIGPIRWGARRVRVLYR
jgi:hypothetical protein